MIGAIARERPFGIEMAEGAVRVFGEYLNLKDHVVNLAVELGRLYLVHGHVGDGGLFDAAAAYDGNIGRADCEGNSAAVTCAAGECEKFFDDLFFCFGNEIHNFHGMLR